MNEIFKDGRAFAHFIEAWLALNYDFSHVKGCKKYDFIDSEGRKYDEKTFTINGCSCSPSNMKGAGRKFDQQKFDDSASNLIYVVVSNVHFPEIKVKFVKGDELMVHYPKGEIPLKDFDKFFD
jgi:hypothetical protein